ncbi:hypothetical protein V8E53_008243 [Lactarius tabidus]
MAVPPKYKRKSDFHKYYTGQATAPVLTIVIGGNHETSILRTICGSCDYHGGLLAPNIYFLGHAGCVQVNGIRIAGHFEKQPYDNSTMSSICRILEYNVRRLALPNSQPHPALIARGFLSHDWPCGVEQYGDLNYLLRRKLFLRGDIQSKQLGSPLPVMSLLRNLRARVQHEPPGPSTVTASNPDVIGDEDDNFDIPSTTARQNQAEIVLENEIETFLPPPLAPRETKFLALPYLSRKREQTTYPDPDAVRAAVAREWDRVHEHALPKLGAEFRIDACQRFVQGVDGAHQQIDAFVTLLGVENVVR